MERSAEPQKAQHARSKTEAIERHLSNVDEISVLKRRFEIFSPPRDGLVRRDTFTVFSKEPVFDVQRLEDLRRRLTPESLEPSSIEMFSYSHNWRGKRFLEIGQLRYYERYDLDKDKETLATMVGDRSLLSEIAAKSREREVGRVIDVLIFPDAESAKLGRPKIELKGSLRDEAMLKENEMKSKAKASAEEKSAASAGTASTEKTAEERAVKEYEPFMREALKEGEAAFAEGGYGIGAVLVLDGKVVARAKGSVTHTKKDPRQHAETQLFDKIDIGSYTRDDFRRMAVVTTLESCIMCYGTCVIMGIGKIVYGMRDDLAGFTPSSPDQLRPIHRNQMPEVIGGVLEKECTELFTRNRDELDAKYKTNLFV